MLPTVRQPIRLVCVFGGLLLATTSPTSQAQQSPPSTSDNTAMPQEVVVTGSLIKHAASEVAEPITVITAEDMAARGFATIADALQQASFSTGSVQGPQTTNGFTQGARTISMFGLSPSYIKYLIDGLPMSDYPALYNGTDTFVSIGGIPMSMVDRIEILPGGQSSLYGSDAIAGVVNIIMKKKVDGLTVDGRYGFTRAGGGVDRTLSIADSWNREGLNVLAGVQFDKTDPIWGYQRGLTSQYFADGTSPQVASRDYAIFGLNGRTGDGLNDYYFEDPAKCQGVTSLFSGTEAFHSRRNHGDYCGTVQSGYYTINNGSTESDLYLRSTLQLNPSAELYADFLGSNNNTNFSAGPGTYNSTFDPTSSYNNFWDPNLQDNLSFQHHYSPEEVGNLDNTLSYSVTNNLRMSLGVRGHLTTHWEYDVAATFNEQKLTEKVWNLLTQNVESFYANLFGPKQGVDPNSGYAIYTPNYAAFYTTITPQQYANLNGYPINHSNTENTLYRGQLSNSDLFKLPGGAAGLALVAEIGHQVWDYRADPGFSTNEFFGLTSSGSSEGNRLRSALTGELRLPVLPSLLVDASGRYDDYRLAENSVSKITYMGSVEYRPIKSVLARFRAGTAFKAPTLSDQFQALSGSYIGATDYYQCAEHGYTGANLVNCPFPSGGSIFSTTSGNHSLKSINANVWNAGLVWDGITHLLLEADYLHWTINNEVSQLSSDKLLQEEAACRLGHLDPHSPTCVNDFAMVMRDSDLQLVSVFTPKVNVSQETVNAFTFKGSYRFDTQHVGSYDVSLAWTDMIKHQFQQYAGDPIIDLLANPFYSTDFKSKVNGSVTWEMNKFSSTVYAIRNGQTPNYLATVSAIGYATPGAAALAAYYSVNWSVGYQWSDRLSLSARVTNLFNAMPPADHSYPGTTAGPFNSNDYDPYGRAFQLEFSYKQH